MSANNNDSLLQTTSSLTPSNSINKKSSEEPKRRKSPFSMQKELFLNHSELLAKYSQSSHSVSPVRKRVADKINPKSFDLQTNSKLVSGKKKKRVLFKGNFIQIINVISYKKYYIEEEKQQRKQEHISRCNCFIF